MKQSDELDRYLIMDIDKTTLSNYPLLSKLAQGIHSISATCTSVERQTNLSP